MIDLSQDYLLVEDPQSVTLHKFAQEGESGPEYGESAFVDFVDRHVATRQDYLDLGVTGQEVAIFHLWAARLDGLEPDRQDVIAEEGDAGTEDGGTQWRVRAVDVMDGRQRFRCACVKVGSVV